MCPPPPASPAAGVNKVVVKTTLAGSGAALADGLDAAEQRRLAEALRSRLTSATTDVEVAEVLYTVSTVATIRGLALDPTAETRRRLEQAYAASVALPVDRVELGRVAPHDEAAGDWFQIVTGRRLAAAPAAVVDIEFVIRTRAAAEVGLATAAARRGTAALVLAKQLTVAGLGPAVKVEAVAAEAQVEAAVAFAVVTAAAAAVDAETQVGALLGGATGLGADLAAAVGGGVRAVGPVEVAEPRRDGPGAEAPPAPEARPGEGEGARGGGGLRARRALPLVAAAAGALVVLGAAGWARRRWRRRRERLQDAAIPDAG